MAATPTIEVRPEMPYVGIRDTVTMTTFSKIADRFLEVFGWIAERGLTPAGAPFFRYHVIDMEGDLDLEIGVPLDSPVPGSGDVTSGVVPAGRYVTLSHTGHPDQLIGVTAELLAWADAQGLAWDMTPTPAGEKWASRLETYFTDPREQPDMSKWVVELAFKLAG
jgi:effector-binding domain-containing protein